MYSLGIDIGSTTAKAVLMKDGEVVFSRYERHFSRVREKTLELFDEASKLVGGEAFCVAVSGSAGMGLAQNADLPFVQEVFATGETVRALEPDTSCVIVFGGEDAKIIFFDGGIDERMNGSCAGGTGAFIDQMATLLNVTPDELDTLSLGYDRIYPIASRCGVFAKTDIQPLLNQGARKEDVAASVYQAVVNQTIAGLARGKKIRGKVLFLGGPLFYCKGLRIRFRETLGLSDGNAVFPEYGRFAVAIGTAFYALKENRPEKAEAFSERLNRAQTADANDRLPPLFTCGEEYEKFCARHSTADVKSADISVYCGEAYLGIDCGSTTTKLVLLTDDDRLLYSYYASNRGEPVEIVREQLMNLYFLCGDRIVIKGSAVTGYGEELIKNAFSVDFGIVETIAHYTAAKYFKSDVDFILDIGGQDIKCFRIRNGAIDSIMLNEACSSGCGSFLETFARSMGCSIDEFAQRGLFAEAPVDLGSRCTVFMNSSVKQAQKEGACDADISAGLSISVVKNALYKVIRATDAAELGENIVVQGGTFLNDAVLRAFEQELGHNVIRPSIAGLMGAYGAALYSKRCKCSTIISRADLEKFRHSAASAVCRGCTNRCHLTVNTFADGHKYISGNQCEKGLGLTSPDGELPNLYRFKREYLQSLSKKDKAESPSLKLGLPLALGMYELLPLWYGIFSSLGVDITVSEMSTRRTYERGQFSIPSDTACYPAKIMHGHVVDLINSGVDAVFYPSLTYNVKEKGSDNHFNCPVVAYYSELLNGNLEELQRVKFLYPPLNVNSRRKLARELYEYFGELLPHASKRDFAKAVKNGFEEYEKYMAAIRSEGEKAIKYARDNGKRIVILAGRPYHIDSEIGHGIDKLASSLGFVVVSEDSVAHLGKPVPVKVLNQWTYHARLYRAASYAAENPDTELVQLVSFGCGVDAITTDEVREILESRGKYYTQIKIDEITNLGAVKIRLRSLIGALKEGGDK